ncbi:MAG: hypothetical protein IJ766_06505 [Clostridia bacterium]|nr:hypothetical protein [Clostridia bacterium]
MAGAEGLEPSARGFGGDVEASICVDIIEFSSHSLPFKKNINFRFDALLMILNLAGQNNIDRGFPADVVCCICVCISRRRDA